MTEYWVSSKKHYCDICNCWMSGYKMNIRNHEKSSKHLQNLKKTMSEAIKRREEKTKEQNFIMEEMNKLKEIGEKYLTQLEGKESKENKKERNVKLEELYNRNSYNNAYMNPTTTTTTNNNNNNWIMMIDESNECVVFVNRLNHQITYEQPKEYIGYIPEKQAFSESNGWYKSYDANSGNYYFYNMYNGQSIWQYIPITTIGYSNSSSSMDHWKEIIKQNQITTENVDGNNSSFIHDSSVTFQKDHSYLLKEEEHTDISNDKEKNSYNIIIKQTPKEDELPPTDSMSTEIQKEKIREIKEENEMYQNKQNEYKRSEEKNKNKINISLEGNKKVKKTRWDKRCSPTEEDNNEVVDHNIEDTEQQSDNSKIKIDNDSNKNKEDKGYEETKDATNHIRLVGEWNVVDNRNIEQISNERIEEIFYNIKSKEQLEKEEIQNLEEHIKDEYSMCNEFYVKKKELEHEDLYMSQEFKFIEKPVYRKAIDKNLQKKKIEFAKRTIKPKNKKSLLS